MSDVIGADQLRLFIERIERLEEEKKGIADDIKDVKSEVKSQGFDVATINAIVKLRRMDVNRRREAEALLDTYKAALGMLDGTPLGRWAVERLHPAKSPADDAQDIEEAEALRRTEEAGGFTTETAQTVDDARRLGGEAAQAGKPVTSNPFPARDVRRAAWDEAWCAELGSDGMDIPDAWKPKKADKTEQPAGVE